MHTHIHTISVFRICIEYIIIYYTNREYLVQSGYNSKL